MVGEGVGDEDFKMGRSGQRCEAQRFDRRAVSMD